MVADMDYSFFIIVSHLEIHYKKKPAAHRRRVVTHFLYLPQRLLSHTFFDGVACESSANIIRLRNVTVAGCSGSASSR